MRIKTTVYYCLDCGETTVYEQRILSELSLLGQSFIMKNCICGKTMETLTILSNDKLPPEHRHKIIEAAQKVLTPLAVEA
jgi:hypothetical protein